MTKKNNLKKIAEEIKKIASAPPAPPKGYSSTGVQSYHPAAYHPSTSTSAETTKSIKNMQHAIQQFAADTFTYSMKKGKPGETPVVDDDKKPFNDFITEQYMANSPIKGQEYSTDSKNQKQDSKQATDLVEMNNVVDSLKRIGSQHSELLADNLWDFRTNNALKNVYAFAYSLVNLSKDFGRTNVNSFNQQDLDQMAKLIPTEENPSKMSSEEKEERANALTPLILKLDKFYHYYVDAIANHPAYVRYITGEDALMKVNPKGGDPLALTPEEQKLLPDVNQLTVDLGQGPVPLSYFKDLNTFKKFLVDQLHYQPNQTGNPQVLMAFLSTALKKLQTAQPKPQPDYGF